jgi:hypothetical protein
VPRKRGDSEDEVESLRKRVAELEAQLGKADRRKPAKRKKH